MLHVVYSFRAKIIFCLCFWNIQARSSSRYDPNIFLNSVLSEIAKGNEPVIFVLETMVPGGSADHTMRTNDVQPSLSENDAYNLFGLLKTAQEQEQLDDEAERTVEATKDILRTAFRSRCQQKDECEIQCPPKKKKCKSRCEKVFDALLACPPPRQTHCESNNRGCGGGKTMPPKWLLRSLLRIGSQIKK